MSKIQMLVKKTRGVSMVEYALLVTAVMLLAAFGYRNLGKSVKHSAVESKFQLDLR